MPKLRVGLAQVDHVVGDLAGNSAAVRRWSAQAAELGCDLVAFPEMMITGYPPEDLVLRGSFVAASLAARDQLAADLAADGLGDLAVVVGYCGRSAAPATAVGRPAGEPQNAVALLHRGRAVADYAKHHLPNYGVFDEFRYFVRGDQLPVVRVGGVDVVMLICEDLWQEGGPIAVAAAAGAGLVVCVNGSPYERGKDDTRGDLVARRARQAGAALAYVNAVGGQDELLFDGDSMVADHNGLLLTRAPLWVEGLVTVELDLPNGTSRVSGPVDAADGTVMTVHRLVLPEPPPRDKVAAPARHLAEPLPDEAEVWAGVRTGIRDYARKNGFSSIVVSVSGGIDSAVVATLAADAVGAENVHVVSLPSPYSSTHSVEDAQELAERQGLQWSLIPIGPILETWTQLVPLHGVALENLQARIRGMTLMSLNNEHGHLVLSCGNKSELATGFSTLYGDSAGGFAPLKDVPKTLVWRLARWRNAQAVNWGQRPPIPQRSIDKPPSAELAPGQLDTDRLPDYPVLDAVLEDYVTHDRGRAELVALGHPAEVVDQVIRLVDAAEHKRRQSPPGPKITSRAFGRDRRLPITSRWRDPL